MKKYIEISRILCYNVFAVMNESELSLKEISERLNFANEYYFNTFFKKYSGMTPGEYRKMSTAK